MAFTVTFGRVGAAGTAQTKTFPDEARAQKEHDKLVAEKLKKGYVETTPGAGKPAGPAPASLRESLEAAVVDDPDELANHMAYADYLAEQGDPLGDFIRVQLSLEDETKKPAERKRLKQQEAKLLKAHGRAWMGELAPLLFDQPEGAVTGSFRRGWLDALHLGRITVNLARALARAPQTRLLRALEIDYVASHGEDNEYEPGEDVPEWETHQVQFNSLHPLLRSPYLGNVRRFHLGQLFEKDDYGRWEGSYTLGPAAADLTAKMRRVEELRLWTRGVDLDKLFALPLRELRVLQVYHMNQRHPLEKLAKNATLRQLTHLQFHPHYYEEYEYWD